MCNPTPPDGGACNSLGPSLTPVTLQCVPGTLPAAHGGAITNGVYVLATATYYGSMCPPSEVDRDRWLVCGTNWQTLQDYTVSGGMEMSNTFDFNVTQSGTSLQLQGVCGVPPSTSYTFSYSATPTTISLYIPSTSGGTPGEGRIDTYTLQ